MNMELGEGTGYSREQQQFGVACSNAILDKIITLLILWWLLLYYQVRWPRC